jgi:hypothetical protein
MKNTNHYHIELNGIVEVSVIILLSHKRHSCYTVELSADDEKIGMPYSVGLHSVQDSLE